MMTKTDKDRMVLNLKGIRANRKTITKGKNNDWNIQLPEKTGKIDIYPQIVDANQAVVTIMGDPEGLRYLAEVTRRWW